LILPEEDTRKKIADYLHISDTSTLKLLEALGGECAGMIFMYDIVATIIYPFLTDKLSMKIGSHYEIDKVCKEDFTQLAKGLNIKMSVIQGIFKDFSSKLDSAFEKLKENPKINLFLLEKIFDEVRNRLFTLHAKCDTLP
jgi:hypothetical protein